MANPTTTNPEVPMVANDSRRAGCIAAKAERFGEFGRYRVAPVHTRFDAVQWFVWDAETVDDVTGGAAVIRQAETRDKAVAGLV